REDPRAGRAAAGRRARGAGGTHRAAATRRPARALPVVGRRGARGRARHPALGRRRTPQCAAGGAARGPRDPRRHGRRGGAAGPRRGGGRGPRGGRRRAARGAVRAGRARRAGRRGGRRLQRLGPCGHAARACARDHRLDRDRAALARPLHLRLHRGRFHVGAGPARPARGGPGLRRAELGVARGTGMTTSPFVVAGASAVLLAASAAGQEPRLEARLDPVTYRGVVLVIEQARARGLPTEPLVDKALEGVAKRAPGERIIGAVARLSERLAAAHAALGPDASLAEVQAGAEALAVGVPEEALKELRAAVPDGSLAVPLGVLTQLVSRGIAASSPTETTLQLVRRRARPPPR